MGAVAAVLLDTHPGVKKWVKNERPGFFIPYRRNGLPARYVPDFVAVTDSDQNVNVEIKGQVADNADAKAKAAKRWCKAVTRLGQLGTRHFLLGTEPGRGRCSNAIPQRYGIRVCSNWASGRRLQGEGAWSSRKSSAFATG